MVSKPLVSVIMPVYNAEKYLKEAILSIINQTFSNFELIVVDDCSKDNSSKIINELASKDKRIITLTNSQNLKLSKTLNRAIEVASGKYLARMDADDISVSTRIEKQVELMEKESDVVLVGCDVEIIDESNNTIGYRRYYELDEQIRKWLFFFSPFCHPAVMIRRSAIEKIGGYDDNFNPAEDYELYFRLGTLGKFRNLKEQLFCYRIVKNSMTHSGMINMENKTLEVREKYKKVYKMPILAILYSLIHRVSLFFVKPGTRLKLFNFVRQRILS
jgi:glycosyltransferase involved in cell wall biosynthesis